METDEELVRLREEVERAGSREEALRESAEVYQLLADHTNDLIHLMGLDGRVVYTSPSVDRVLGRDPARPVAEGWDQHCHPEDVEAGRRAWERVLAGEKATATFRVRHRDGAFRWMEAWVSLVRYRGEPHVLSVCRDITERRRAEDAQKESERKLADAQRVAHVGHWTRDLASDRITWSDEAYRIFGLAPQERTMDLSALQELIVPEDRPRVLHAVEQALRGGPSYDLEYRLIRPDGEMRVVHSRGDVTRDGSGRPCRMFGTVQDVTERKCLEDQLRIAQKMEAVGRLAGGVAHDFNNLLMVINGCAAMLSRELPASERARELLAEIQKAGERAASLTRQLLVFSRKRAFHPRATDLNELIGDLAQMLEWVLGEQIELTIQADPGLGLVEVDPGQLEQALMNLVVNARDAMPDGGRLAIETRDFEATPSYAEAHPDVRPGRHALVVISDTGHGMDEATRARIFEPFFTTKSIGQGTGLGLSMVHGVVRQSGGHIDVTSEPGGGATFTIHLPVVPPPVPGEW